MASMKAFILIALLGAAAAVGRRDLSNKTLDTQQQYPAGAAVVPHVDGHIAQSALSLQQQGALIAQHQAAIQAEIRQAEIINAQNQAHIAAHQAQVAQMQNQFNSYKANTVATLMGATNAVSNLQSPAVGFAQPVPMTTPAFG